MGTGSTASELDLLPASKSDSGLSRWLKPVFAIASRIDSGSLTAILPDGRRLKFQGEKPGANGVITVHNEDFARKLIKGGGIGFAESFLDADWDSPDLSALLNVVAQNSAKVDAFFGAQPLLRAIQRAMHFLNGNTRRGAKKNIHFHYDLGNDFYRQWLDATMTYSSARFAHPGQSLPDAQHNKYISMADHMKLRRDDHILEIGSGWGGFAEFAAKEHGCTVTGITLSEEQLDYSRKRIFDAGLAEKVKFELTDYRDVEGQYDRIASIEMYEAVGEKYWPAYFSKIYDCLKPNGIAGLQVITINDDFYDAYRRNSDFIRRYIFPGGMLASQQALRAQVENAGLQLRTADYFGNDYARTLRAWHENFEAAWPNIQRIGFDERFRRLWNYYLSYCEAGFQSGNTDVGQITIGRAN
jgi:cyclopropane-fatty-acyl-phospholipid synthase